MRNDFITCVQRTSQAVLLLAALVLTACGEDENKDKAMKIIAFGDSLTAGYGLMPEEAFPAQLADKLETNGYTQITMINAGISGDTTQDGLSRVQSVLDQNPDIVILALGANDMLQSVNPEKTRANLSQMLQLFKDHNIQVLLAGMQASFMMGMQFSDEVNTLYPALAEEYDVAFYPFFLEGVAKNPALNLPDRVHPNAEGVSVMVENIYPVLEEMLENR